MLDCKKDSEAFDGEADDGNTGRTYHKTVEVQETRNESEDTEKFEQALGCKDRGPSPFLLCAPSFTLFLDIPAGPS